MTSYINVKVKRRLIDWLSLFYDVRTNMHGNIQMRLRPRKQKHRRLIRTGEWSRHARMKALGVAFLSLFYKVRITKKGRVHLGQR